MIDLGNIGKSNYYRCIVEDEARGLGQIGSVVTFKKEFSIETSTVRNLRISFFFLLNVGATDTYFQV